MPATNFNPHSREGSDRDTDCRGDGVRISIHTPARGVTVRNLTALKGIGISIHTPARGVTSPDVGVLGPYVISIHTPARGVTRKPGAKEWGG